MRRFIRIHRTYVCVYVLHISILTLKLVFIHANIFACTRTRNARRLQGGEDTEDA